MKIILHAEAPPEVMDEFVKQVTGLAITARADFKATISYE